MMPHNAAARTFVCSIFSIVTLVSGPLCATTIDDFSLGDVSLVDTLDYRDSGASLRTGLSPSHTLPTARYVTFNAINPAPYSGTGIAVVSVNGGSWKLAADRGV